MIRRFFNLIAASSFLMGLVVLALWASAPTHYFQAFVAIPGSGLCLVESGNSSFRGLRILFASPWQASFAAGYSNVPRGADLRWITSLPYGESSNHVYQLGDVNGRPLVLGHGNLVIDVADGDILTGESLRANWGTTQRALLFFNDIFVPHWAIATCLLLLPMARCARWLINRFIRYRRSEAGYCINCNYDLRATPKLCPECGHVPQQA